MFSSRSFLRFSRYGFSTYGLAAVLFLAGCGDDPAQTSASQSEPPLSRFAQMEKDLFDAQNALRVNPPSVLPSLKFLAGRFNANILENRDGARVRTQEGAPAVTEAILFIQSAVPVKALKRSKLLDASAREHQQDQERSGEVGHRGSDGSMPNDRIRRHAMTSGLGENITYGTYGGDKGSDGLIGLFVDDGVPDRGHRDNLMEPRFEETGIACGPHIKYKHMCVINYGSSVRALRPGEALKDEE